MSNSVRPHRQQPTRLPRPWDSPGKNTGVGCHFLLQCMKVNSLSRVWLFATPWTAAHQAPLPMGFSRQEYWSGVPLPSACTLLLLLLLSRFGRVRLCATPQTAAPRLPCTLGDSTALLRCAHLQMLQNHHKCWCRELEKNFKEEANSEIQNLWVMKIDCNSPYQQNMKKKQIAISTDTEKLFEKLYIPSW